MQPEYALANNVFNGATSFYMAPPSGFTVFPVLYFGVLEPADVDWYEMELPSRQAEFYSGAIQILPGYGEACPAAYNFETEVTFESGITSLPTAVGCTVSRANITNEAK